MAAGKSTIGRRLARLLDASFVDTDEAIVARHGPIPQLFSERGEAAFRALEFEAVRDALEGPPGVLALGGGALTHAPTRALLAERALRVYLDIPADELVRRLQRSRAIRPVAGAQPSVERVRELLSARLPFYLESDLIVRGPHGSRLAFAREIAARLRATGAWPNAPAADASNAPRAR
jgi:shikimate kinase